MKNLTLGLILLLAIACNDLQPDLTAETLAEESYSEVLTPSYVSVKTGESVKIPLANLQLQLESLTDNRCPADVSCIRAGEAVSEITLTSLQDPSQTKNLSLCLGCPETNDSTEFLLNNHKYLLVLKEVTPYPFANKPETMQDKTAAFLIQPME